jgi:hypothetical protein
MITSIYMYILKIYAELFGNLVLTLSAQRHFKVFKNSGSGAVYKCTVSPTPPPPPPDSDTAERSTHTVHTARAECSLDPQWKWRI